MDVMTTSHEQQVKDRVELARLDTAAERSATDPASALASLPWLTTSIAADARAGLFARWGRSTVIDENTGTAVLPEPLFTELHLRAGVDGRFPVGNAGLLHVYGYLLSAEPTPYGLKRERWLEGSLARAYGLDARAFLPWASPGDTLLARVTAAATALLATHVVHEEPLGGAAGRELTGRVAIGRVTPSAPAALAYALDRCDDSGDGRGSGSGSGNDTGRGRDSGDSGDSGNSRGRGGGRSSGSGGGGGNDTGRLLITTFPVASPDAVLAAVRADGPRLRWNAVG